MTRAVPFAAILLVFGCSSASNPTYTPPSDAGDAGSEVTAGGDAGPGQNCKTTADCTSGLSCIDLAMTPPGGTCTSDGKACSKTCTGDPDCAALGASFKCFAGCPGNPKFCGAT
jgi:hypothetical protein